MKRMTLEDAVPCSSHGENVVDGREGCERFVKELAIGAATLSDDLSSDKEAPATLFWLEGRGR